MPRVWPHNSTNSCRSSAVNDTGHDTGELMALTSRLHVERRTMSDVTQICTFTLNDLLLGISVDDVHEVLPAQTLTPVPLVPPTVAGLLNMRGQIVSALDLRCVLRLPPRSKDSPPPMHIIVRRGQEPLSLLVDQVGEILQIDSQRLLPPPDSTPPETRNLFRGAFPLPERLLLLLDTCQALETIVSQATAKSRWHAT